MLKMFPDFGPKRITKPFVFEVIHVYHCLLLSNSLIDFNAKCLEYFFCYLFKTKHFNNI